MSRLNIPAKAGGTGELREEMQGLSTELRAIEAATESLSKQVQIAIYDALLKDGMAAADAIAAATPIATELRTLSEAVGTAAYHARRVSEHAQDLKTSVTRARQVRAQAVS